MVTDKSVCRAEIERAEQECLTVETAIAERRNELRHMEDALKDVTDDTATLAVVRIQCRVTTLIRMR